MLDPEFFKAVEALKKPAVQTMAAPAALPAGNFCDVYKPVRPLLVEILPILKAIPGFGPQIAEGVQAFMAAADAICGVSAGGAAVHADFFAAVKRFDPAGAAAFAMPAAPAAFPGDLCKTYNSIKPILQGLLPFLSLIPGYGAAIEAGLTALMAVLNQVCPQ